MTSARSQAMTVRNQAMTVSETSETDTESVLKYECPYCGEVNKVETTSLGSNVKCVNAVCGRRFRVQVPAGQLIEDGDLSISASGDQTHAELAESERTLLTRHPAMFGNHPLRFVGCLILVGSGIAGAAFADRTADAVLTTAGVAVAAAGALALIIWWLHTRFQSVIVTSKRTIYQRGVFSKHTSEVQHDDVRNMQADQSFFDRVARVGHVAISSSGQDEMEISVKGLKSPNEVIEIIRRYQ